MKKILSTVLAALLLFSCPLVVSAEDSFVMTATKEVEITYVLSIPQAVDIDPTQTTTAYGDEEYIENIMQPIQILEAAGFTENNKQLSVTLNHPGVLVSSSDDEIPYVIHIHSDDTQDWDIDLIDIPSGQTFNWYPDADLGSEGTDTADYQTKLIYNNSGTLRRVSHWGVYIKVADWDAAPVGTYTATVSFSVSTVDKA